MFFINLFLLVNKGFLKVNIGNFSLVFTVRFKEERNLSINYGSPFLTLVSPIGLKFKQKLREGLEENTLYFHLTKFINVSPLSSLVR